MSGRSRVPEGFAVVRWSLEGQALALVDLPADGDLFAALADAHGLTKAERAVAALALGGLGNDAIALARKASPNTVRNQLSSIFQKLGVASRTELAARHPWLAGEPGRQAGDHAVGRDHAGEPADGAEVDTAVAPAQEQASRGVARGSHRGHRR